MYYSARNIHNRKVNFENIVKEAVGDNNLVRTRAFTISTKEGDEQAFFEALRKSGMEVVSKELLEYDSGNKKGDWDVGITIDIVSMLDMLDVVVLVSGDGDFVPLGEYVKARGRIFHVASFRESTSTALVDTSDIYTNLSDDKRKYLIANRGGDKSAPRKQTRGAKKPTKKRTTKKAAAPAGEFIIASTSDTEEDIEESRTRRLTF
jgi:uncharacterized LabA/DUF88 family protein